MLNMLVVSVIIGAPVYVVTADALIRSWSTEERRTRQQIESHRLFEVDQLRQLTTPGERDAFLAHSATYEAVRFRGNDYTVAEAEQRLSETRATLATMRRCAPWTRVSE